MSHKKLSSCRLAGVVVGLVSFVTQPTLAQTPAPASQAAPQQSTAANPMVNLLNLLVQRGVLTRDEATTLQRQAEQDAASAKPVPAAAASVSNGTVRVPYVPEVVKKEIREDIKKEVLAQAQAENWAAPNAVPDWVQKFHFYGDMRVRGEGDFFPDGNDNTGAFPNFNAINTGSPFDVSAANPNFSPQRNVDEDRYRMRLRARLGVDINLGDHFSSGLRIATGENNSPVSSNQSLGAASNGQGANFSKYALWLDRAYLKYEPLKEENKGFAISLGRFDNPFFSTTLVWADSLGFDGVAATAKFKITDRENNFITIGAFPVFNTDFNFSSNQPDKFSSDDKWLFGAQYGTDWKITKDLGLKLAGAYYYFQNVEGELSSPCTVLSAQDSCDTDATRPAFAQYGNTYRALRNIIADTSNLNGTVNQFQYFGLATSFEELVLTGRLDINHFDPFHVSIDGEFVKNLAFDKKKIEQIAVNNRGASPDPGNPNVVGPYEGGDTGYYVSLTAGSRILEKWGDWNVLLGYKYVESDAVVDGLTDSDFGLGGTNLKGYILGANLALSSNVWASLRWMSADAIAGSPLKVDVLYLDVSGRF